MNWRSENVLMGNDPYYYTKFVGGNDNWRNTVKYDNFLRNVPQFDRNDNMWAQKLNSFNQSVLSSDGYRLRHDWDYLQSRFSDHPMMRLPDNQPYMPRPMQVDGPYPMPLPAVDQRSDMPTSQYDANVVAAELLKGTEAFFEAVEDAEMYYRDDGNQKGPNADMVIDALERAEKEYPVVRQHLEDLDSGVPAEQVPVVQNLKQNVDDAMTKAQDIKAHMANYARTARAGNCGVGKKLFCVLLILLIIAAAVYAGMMWNKGEGMKMMESTW